MDGWFLFGLSLFFLFGLFFLVLELNGKSGASFLAVCFFVVFGFIFGSYVDFGRPICVGSPGSQADFVVGHHYETLAKVPSQKKGPKNDLFVIKDGQSDEILLIRTNHTELPPRFTVDDKGNIIAVPPTAPVTPTSVTPESPK